jgi:hypothetical protein
MRTRRLLSAILGGILAGSLGPVGLARADGPSAAICAWTGRATFSPGLTLTPQHGTLQFEERSGSIDCQGTVRGAEVTGPGTLGLQGEYGLGPLAEAFGGGACHEGGAQFVFAITLPTKRGPVELSTTANAEHVGPIGQYQGPSFSGVLRFSPATGDCLNSPATELVMSGQGILLTPNEPAS